MITACPKEVNFQSLELPDTPFHNIKATRSGDSRVLSSSGTSCDGFLSYKFVKRSVGFQASS